VLRYVGLAQGAARGRNQGRNQGAQGATRGGKPGNCSHKIFKTCLKIGWWRPWPSVTVVLTLEKCFSALAIALGHLYLDEAIVATGDAVEVLATACFLRFNTLIDSCCKVMTANLAADTVCLYLEAATRVGGSSFTLSFILLAFSIFVLRRKHLFANF